MSNRTVLFAAFLTASCAASTDGVFTPDPDDETIDPADPPNDPDPEGTELGIPDSTSLPELPTEDQAIAAKAGCPKRSATLSPKGLTFVIHISKHDDEASAALHQLESVKHLIRARDIFMFEHKTPLMFALRAVFPCNDFHIIAYPEELGAAFDAGNIADGIAVDWETSSFTNPQSYTVDKLSGYADKIHGKHQIAGEVPYWPQAFDDGHITKVAHMNYDLAQIQDHCAGAGPSTFGDVARGLVKNFIANGLAPRDVGFEISLDSFADAGNHTGVETSADCTRKAYGKGARAIYLYGNGHPHLDDYFKRIAAMGVRRAN